MPRANRHHLPGYVWHIAHRCHCRRVLWRTGVPGRTAEWSESIAVGGREFIERVTTDLGPRALRRQVEPRGDLNLLRDAQSAYNRHSAPEMAALRGK